MHSSKVVSGGTTRQATCSSTREATAKKVSGKARTTARGVSRLVVVLGLIATMLATVGSAPAGASVNQVTLADEVLTHSDSQWAQVSSYNEPADWVSPINYKDGNLYIRMDVTAKPSNMDLLVQVCLWRNDSTIAGGNQFETETCSPTRPFNAVDTYWLDFGSPEDWWVLPVSGHGRPWAWDQPTDIARLMIKDAATGNLLRTTACNTACYDGSQGPIGDHVPITLDTEWILVDQGAVLTPPTSWEPDCPGTWSPNCQASPLTVSNTQVDPTAHAATVTFDTSAAADGSADYGIGAPSGNTVGTTSNQTSHSLNFFFLECATTYEVQASADNGAVVATGAVVSFTTDPCVSAPFSDDFTGGMAADWRFADPPGGATLTTSGGAATIAIPFDNEHDLYAGENDAARLRQDAPAGDFTVEAEFDSTPAVKFQLQGIVVEEDEDSFFRFGVYHNGVEPKYFAASIVDGVPTVQVNVTAATQATYLLRVSRSADNWTFQHSDDGGTTWTVLGSFSEMLAPKHLGPYIGTADPSGSPKAPAYTGVIDRFTKIDSTGPTFLHFQGTNVPFGTPGMSQADVNVMGRVTDPDGVASLTYSLNGGTAVPMEMGDNLRRLALTGDFNADIDSALLNSGANTVLFTATDTFGNISTDTVTVNYTPGNTWAPTYSIDWSTVTTLHDVAQPVDGNWYVSGDTVRIDEQGYDRILAIGDDTWESFTATVPVTIEAVDTVIGNRAPSNGPGVGLMVHWAGHGIGPGGAGDQPKWGFANRFGGILWYRYNSGDRFQALNGNAVERQSNASMTLALNTTYMFKVEVDASTVDKVYRLRVWEEGTAEPTDWVLEMTTQVGQSSGSLALLSHHVDAAFGDVTVIPGTAPDVTPPVVVIDNPLENELINGPVTINGTVTDTESDIDRVEIVLKDKTNSMWWNGLSWQPVYTRVTANHVDGDWDYTFTAPAGSLNFFASVWAWDTEGNFNSPRPKVNFGTTSNDVTPPIVTLDTPTDGAIVTTPMIDLAGTITDEASGSGVDRVEVVVRDRTNDLYWNGTTWQVASIRVLATVTGNNWTYSYPTPATAANIYTAVYGWDLEQNYTPRVFINYSNSAPDTTAPILTLDSPQNGETLPGPVTVTGTLTDEAMGSGADRVELLIKDKTSNTWWNGSSWQGTFIRVDATLTGNNWSLTYDAPSSLPASIYTSARGYDADGNQTALTAINYFVSDSVGPTVVILTPTANESTTGVVTVSGTVEDNPGGSGVDRVELVIKDKTNNLWWSGAVWQNTYVRVTVPVTGNTWTYDFTPVVGTLGFYTSAWAWDIVGNTNAPPPFVNYTATN